MPSVFFIWKKFLFEKKFGCFTSVLNIFSQRSLIIDWFVKKWFVTGELFGGFLCFCEKSLKMECRLKVVVKSMVRLLQWCWKYFKRGHLLHLKINISLENERSLNPKRCQGNNLLFWISKLLVIRSLKFAYPPILEGISWGVTQF